MDHKSTENGLELFKNIKELARNWRKVILVYVDISKKRDY